MLTIRCVLLESRVVIQVIFQRYFGRSLDKKNIEVRLCETPRSLRSCGHPAIAVFSTILFAGEVQFALRIGQHRS